jgi:hypothetical protein
MSLRNACLLMSAWLAPVALVAQHSSIKERGLLAEMAQSRKSGEAFGMETSPPRRLKGGGPYWILFQYAEGPFVNPIFFKATDSRAKILFVLPKKWRGLEEFQGLAWAVQKNHHGGNHF